MIPYTGGKHYKYITEGEYNSLKEKDHYTMENFEVGNPYKIVRIAKSEETDEIVFMTLDAQLVWLDEEKMVVAFGQGHGKIMRLDGYKAHWFFLPQLIN